MTASRMAKRLGLLTDVWKSHKMYLPWPIPDYVGRLLRFNIQTVILSAQILGRPFSIAERLFASGALMTYRRQPKRPTGEVTE